MGKNYVRRGQWYHYCRRVPKHLESFDRRKHIRIALKTKDEKEAQRRAAVYDDFVEKYWSDLIQSRRSDDALDGFRQLRTLAKAYGFAYKNIAEVSESSLDEILARVEAAAGAAQPAKKALLGCPSRSGVPLSDCIDRYWPLCVDRLTEKSNHQIRKYRNPRNAAMKNFIKAVGDGDLSQVDRSHVLAFRQWLMDRIAKGEIVGDTANRQMQHVKDILQTVALEAQTDLNVKAMFEDTRVQERKRSRPPFEAAYVQTAFLKSRSLERLNDEARMLVYIMIETGARESEIIGLTDDDFALQEEIPYLWIRHNALRSLKTKTSERKIPLVGVALSAAKQIAPKGLVRYQDKPDHASSAINKFLRVNGLKPTPEHTLYSLRHTFKDRLRDAGAPEEVIDELMGHRKIGPKYGRGHLLTTKHQWLQRIAFDPPKTL